MGKTLVFPILGPTMVYPNGQRNAYVRSLAEQYEKNGYHVVKGKSWDVRLKKVFLWPEYIRKESLFSENIEAMVIALKKGYTIDFLVDDKATKPVFTKDIHDEKVLALPFCMKGCSAALQLNNEYRSVFEPAGYEYTQTAEFENFVDYDKIVVDPIIRDRTSYRLFALNLLIGSRRGFNIYPIIID